MNSKKDKPPKFKNDHEALNFLIEKYRFMGGWIGAAGMMEAACISPTSFPMRPIVQGFCLTCISPVPVEPRRSVRFSRKMIGLLRLKLKRARSRRWNE